MLSGRQCFHWTFGRAVKSLSCVRVRVSQCTCIVRTGHRILYYLILEKTFLARVFCLFVVLIVTDWVSSAVVFGFFDSARTSFLGVPFCVESQRLQGQSLGSVD